jgi:hypothetical protein
MNDSVDGWLRWKHKGWGMAGSAWSPRSPDWTKRPFGRGAATWPRDCNPRGLSASDALEQEGRLPRRIPPLSAQHLMQLVDPELAGDPNSKRMWVNRSLRKLQHAMRSAGLKLSPHTIARILQDYNISPKANVKHLMPQPHPDRDRQFRYIRAVRKRFERTGLPVISVDTKKKELIGLFYQRGRVWTQKAVEVYTYDFPSDAVARVVPYGIYDTQTNQGAIYLGLDADTPDFAVDAIAHWWLLTVDITTQALPNYSFWRMGVGATATARADGRRSYSRNWPMPSVCL